MRDTRHLSPLRIRAPQQPVDGATVTVRHCEVLTHPPLAAADGNCFFGELVNADSIDTYILSADIEQNGDYLQPDFTIHGFRYAQVSTFLRVEERLLRAFTARSKYALYYFYDGLTYYLVVHRA